MEKLVKGNVFVLPFPFSDLSCSKRRPALVVAALSGEDIILCQITSAFRTNEYSIFLQDNDFQIGKLNLTSLIRPNRLFTADKSIVLYSVGALKESKIKEVENKLMEIFQK